MFQVRHWYEQCILPDVQKALAVSEPHSTSFGPCVCCNVPTFLQMSALSCCIGVVAAHGTRPRITVTAHTPLHKRTALLRAHAYQALSVNIVISCIRTLLKQPCLA